MDLTEGNDAVRRDGIRERQEHERPGTLKKVYEFEALTHRFIVNGEVFGADSVVSVMDYVIAAFDLNQISLPLQTVSTLSPENHQSVSIFPQTLLEPRTLYYYFLAIQQLFCFNYFQSELRSLPGSDVSLYEFGN